MTRGASRARLSRAAVAMLAVCAGGAISNVYAFQPAVGEIAVSMGVPPTAVSGAIAAAFLGYLLGLVVLVPLADRVSARILVSAQLIVLAGCLGLASVAPDPALLAGAFLFVGAATTVAAQSSAIVGALSEPVTRGASLGIVSAGISAGLLVSRFVGGALTDLAGWRGALLICAAVMVVCAGISARVVPHTAPITAESFVARLRSLPRLWRRHPLLRRSAAAGMLWFFAFNLVWMALTLVLDGPPYSLSASTIGLYGLAGALGLVVTRVAGRLADRWGSRAVLLGGLATAAASVLLLLVSLGSPLLTAAGLALFDAGCFAAQVATQAQIVSLDPPRSGGLLSAYLTLYYAAGAVGAGTAGALVAAGGWPAAMFAAIAATGTAFAVASRPRALRQRPGGEDTRV